VLRQARTANAWGTIVLHGYSSQEGGETYNKKLSLERALRVKRLLVDGGFPEKHIRVVAHGQINDAPTLALNRRVWVVFQP
jgi:outer membrane protein OmpA-like peptidoglycan-associated protein